MKLLKFQNNRLSSIKEKPFKLEKNIQFLVEDNLTELLGLKFVKSEFIIGEFRIDTLAFEEKSNSFVIIEYKRSRNLSVIDQGFTYLSLMLNNKADFILEYNEALNKNLKKDFIDWTQSRIIFISPQFSSYQKESINFKDLPIELYEIARYENNLISFNQIKARGATESIKTVSGKDKKIQNVTKEIVIYTEHDHLKIATPETRELYENLKELIFSLGNVEIKPTKLYIAFVSNSNFVDAHIQKNSVKLWLNLRSGTLFDPKNIARDVSTIGHWGNGDYEIILNKDSDLDYVISLIKQSFEKHS